MNDSGDEHFEILDVGNGQRRRETSSLPDAPPVQVDAAPASAERATTGIGWRGLVALLVAVVTSVVATAIAMNVRHTAAIDAAEALEASTVRLVLGQIDDEPSITVGETAQFATWVYNAGPRDIDVASVVPNGWAVESDNTARTIAPGTWKRVVSSASPNCDQPPPRDMDVTYLIEDDVNVTTLTMPASHWSVEAAFHSACSERDSSASPDSRASIWAYAWETSESETGGVEMTAEVSAELDGRPVAATLTGVTSAVPGFEVSGPDLPIEVGVDSNTSVTLVWRVVDCAEATTFTYGGFDVDVEGVEVVEGDGGNIEPEALIALARYAETECRS